MWGTVCDYGWDVDDAAVVCGQLGMLGYREEVVAVKNAPYGEGRGPVWIGNVKCDGTENRIEVGDRYKFYLHDQRCMCNVFLFD